MNLGRLRADAQGRTRPPAERGYQSEPILGPLERRADVALSDRRRRGELERVHPGLDMVAVRIESPLVERSKLEVALDFAYPSWKTGRGWATSAAQPVICPSGPARATAV